MYQTCIRQRNGIDTESGRHRPRQLGTYPSQRAARVAAAKFASEGAEGGGKGTVGWLVDRWVTAKTDITEKSQMQNRWAAGHIRKALGLYASINSTAMTSPAGTTS